MPLAQRLWLALAAVGLLLLGTGIYINTREPDTGQEERDLIEFQLCMDDPAMTTDECLDQFTQRRHDRR